MNIFKSGTNNAAKVVSVLAALVLWFNVTAGATFTTLITVPIQYVWPVRGLMVANDIPDQVQVLVRGTGRSLISYNLRKITDHSRQYVLVNLAGLSGGKHQISIEKDQIMLGTDGISVESIIDNGEFPVMLDEKSRRAVTVRVDSIPGLEIDRDIVVVGVPAVTPRYVIIEGPASVISSISRVPVESLVQSRVTLGDTVLTARLDQEFRRFVTVDPKEAVLHFRVEPLTEKTISGVPVRLRDFPWRRRFLAEPDSVTITLRGPRSVIEKAGANDVAASIPYQAFVEGLETGSSAVKLELRLPEGITQAAVSPETVEVVPRPQK